MDTTKMWPPNGIGVVEINHHTTQSKIVPNLKKVKKECEQIICSVREMIIEESTKEH